MRENIDYLRPSTLQEALEILQQYGGKVKPYAGGTDIMVQLRENRKNLQELSALMDVSQLGELQGIYKDSEGDGRLCIGAAVTHTEVCKSKLLQRHIPFLPEAAGTVGSTQIRNSGTIGGNICNASLAADSLSPLIAAEASLIVKSTRGERAIPVKSIYVKNNCNALAEDELAIKIVFKSLERYKSAFIKLGRRKALAISRINVAVAFQLEDGYVQDVRIAPGCVFRTPDRSAKAEAILLHQAPSEQLFQEAGKAAALEMIEQTGIRWSTEYKQPVLEALVKRALTEALEKKGKEE